MTATAATRPTRSPGLPKDWKEQVKIKGSGLPSRLIVHGVEGCGKTSFAAHAPKPIFLMSKGETGLETLIDSGRLPDVPHLPEIQSWEELLSVVDWLASTELDYRTVVLDTLNGFERLCHEAVCEREYAGDWGKKGFASYQQGYDVSTSEWRMLLNALDSLREKRRMAIIGLCHTRVMTFKNPEGNDFDRYAPAVHAKTWELTHRWADHVCFLNFHVEVVTDGRPSDAPKKGKGKGGQERVMYTERHAAYDAKNRGGLAESIDMGSSGQEAWANFISAIKAGKEVK